MSVKDNGIKDVEKFRREEVMTRDEIKATLDFIVSKISRHLDEFTDKYPKPASVNNIYPKQDNVDWTNGFWTGMLWLAYEYTKDERFRKVAEKQCKDFRNRIEKQIAIETHDLGFLYSLSCVAGYKLTGNNELKAIALMAADKLIGRYKEKGEFIQAWGAIDDPSAYRLIIDCMLNMPLLYWASQVTGNPKYYEIGYKHAKTSEATVIREDASTFHTYYFDFETGAPLKGVTHQGFCDDSTWARGQAWGIYGLVLSYLYTKDDRFLQDCLKVTDYFLNRLPADFVPYWDLIFKDGSDEVRDSSAGSIAVCGMLELMKHVENKQDYASAANAVLAALTRSCLNRNIPESSGILLHGVYSKPAMAGVDECTLWGDYFYLEALMRLYKKWELYW